ncbi:UDP-N-acetylmuramoylalanine--D-glutamate ligase [Rothia aeria]|uniref:UDP-N-acetylmuramoylalanine--D-glutamate ligase n=1 Tax=Rothia aeria TaxID=172042 RepID=A0A2Z5QZA0_9MICC|nr:UDP-N-acetylmuramoylalanine--D-glutamate ligase [Rothia aeria]
MNDSKATNPHAANASMSAYPSLVWIAGACRRVSPMMSW